MAGDIKWLGFGAILIPIAFLHVAGCCAQKESPADTFVELEKISKTYRIEIIESKYVENEMKKNRVLNAKVERMKELLLTFCPDMNDIFWENAARCNRDEK